MADASMTPAETEKLRARARRAIDEEGLVALASRIGMEPRTLQMFAHGASRSHRGTVKLVADALSTPKRGSKR